MVLIIKDANIITRVLLDSYYKYEEITICIDTNTIELHNGYFFDDDTASKEIQYQKYTIKRKNAFELIELYFYKDFVFNEYHLYQLNDFIISTNPNSIIMSADQYLDGYYVVFRGGHIETNYESLIINRHKYNNEELKNGDYIEFLSFSFYYFDKFLYMNDALSINKLPKLNVNEEVKSYIKEQLPINNYYEENYKEIEIDKLESFTPPLKNNSRKLILQMGPALTMSLAMLLVAGLNVYNSYLNNGSYISMIALIAMPITMLLSGVMWPIITSFSEKKSYMKEYIEVKNNYMDYLKSYEKDLIKKINEYLKHESNYLFIVEDVKTKLFYITKNSPKFITLNLGYQTKKMNFEYKEIKDKEVNEYINRIKYRAEHMDNVPLFLDLKTNKRISIITYEHKREYYIYRFILELAYKYNYEDITIAIYSKDDSIFNKLYYLPHLFYSKMRLTITSERELQDLNNYSLDKPLVIIMNDYSDYIYSNPNIHVIYVTSNSEKILKESDSVIEYLDNNGVLYSHEKISFRYYEEELDFDYYFSYISKFNKTEFLPKEISFNSIYPGLDIKTYYQNRDKSLKANFAIIGNENLEFDLHESKDGPHGLIGGSTGSGKSELIISLLLSLVLRYPPDYLNLILIDYKGGGIKESLSYNGETIPHVIASIDNLEEDTFERLTVAIERECKRRQRLFKDLTRVSNATIMSIDDYLEINEQYCLEKIAHLIIVVDEFAELKKENPELIKKLISFARIGRSLGIHLLLATQKPSGVIDEEIWSNAHFKIALKVHSEKDSLDIIKSKDAAYLMNPGEFYLAVDDNKVKAKAIYSKKDINNNDQYDVSILNSRLEVIKTKSYKKSIPFLESNYISSKILNVVKELSIKRNAFDYEKPKPLHICELQNKYNSNNHLVLGEIDDYLSAKKGILECDIDENIFIYSSRKKEINNILNTLNKYQRKSIVVSNEKYEGAYISDCLKYNDDEDILFLFNKLLKDTKVDYHLVIEDLNTLISYNEDYLMYLYKLLRRSDVMGLSICILSSSSTFNFKILNSIKNKYIINSYDNQDLINIFGMKGSYKGKSYYYDDIPITFIPAIIDEYMTSTSTLNEYINKIPNKVMYKNDNSNLLIGYEINTRKEVYLKSNEKLLITGYDKELLIKYANIYKNDDNVSVAIYNNKSINVANVLWLGEGLYSQRLFYADGSVDLSQNEGYYYRNNKGCTLRVIDYE